MKKLFLAAAIASVMAAPVMAADSDSVDFTPLQPSKPMTKLEQAQYKFEKAQEKVLKDNRSTIESNVDELEFTYKNEKGEEIKTTYGDLVTGADKAVSDADEALEAAKAKNDYEAVEGKTAEQVKAEAVAKAEQSLNAAKKDKETVENTYNSKFDSVAKDEVAKKIDESATAHDRYQNVDIEKNKETIAEHDNRLTEAEKDIYANTGKIEANKKAIAENRADINKLFGEVERLDDRIDGTQASLHAVTNARPFLSGEGKTAIGVGLGNSNSVQAVAIGAAHAFTDQWSASATINSTFGGEENDFSFGVGTQYEF